jgi:hypothetical protein
MAVSIPRISYALYFVGNRSRVRMCVRPFTNIYIVFVSLVVYTEYMLSKFILNGWFYITDAKQVLVKMEKFLFPW